MRPSSAGAARIAGLTLLTLAGAGSRLAAQSGETAAHAAAPVAQAASLQGAITLDGRLDEGAWAAATPVTTFTQVDPDEGEPVSERTEVYVLYDDDALYIGARLHDSGPVSSRLVRRDATVNDSDWLIVALDSYHDHLSSFRFWVNPAGVRRDELFSSGGNRGGGVPGTAGAAAAVVLDRGGQADASWEPVWSAAAAVGDSGWTA